MKTDHVVHFLDYECEVHLREYSNGRIAIQLVDVNDPSEVICTASVNLPDAFLPLDHVFIKNYSENEGITEVLRDAGIIEPTATWVRSGYVSIQMCKLLIPVPNEP